MAHLIASFNSSLSACSLGLLGRLELEDDPDIVVVDRVLVHTRALAARAATALLVVQKHLLEGLEVADFVVDEQIVIVVPPVRGNERRHHIRRERA